MKKVLLLCSALLVFAAVPSHAVLNVAWTKCLESGGSPGVVFDCDVNAGNVFELCGSFTNPNALINFVAMDAVIDFTDATGLTPFWHFETSPCNALGINLVDDRASGICPSPIANLWGSGGGSSDALITAYVPGATVGRMQCTIARGSTSPINMAGAPTVNFGFRLQFFMDPGGSCAGCHDPVQVTWQKAVLFSVAGANGNESPAVVLNGNDPNSNPCGGVNGANCAGGATAARSKTWGSVKALYR